MKKNLYLLLITMVVIAAGCKKTEQIPVTLPEGKFSGTFRRIHLNPLNNKVDTASANLTVTLSAATGYTVTGDTTTLHAGSSGNYAVDGTYMQFNDKTLVSGVKPVNNKVHLSGLYQYLYDGTTLQIGASNDTLNYFYNLKSSQ